jgi:protein-S-isoprenylcysteine O-methyltransferase Ste14
LGLNRRTGSKKYIVGALPFHFGIFACLSCLPWYNIHMSENTEQKNPNLHKNKEHKALAYSYVLFFLFFLAGVFLNTIFPSEIFKSFALASDIGFTIVVLASLLIFWAQKSNAKLDKEHLSKETFCKGPYRYIKHPTQFGLFMLIFGFSIMINALYLTIFAALYAIIAKITFFKEQDLILEAKYGEPYKEYEKSVKLKF